MQYYSTLMNFLSFVTVPTPVVHINPPDGIVYAGGNLTLLCITTLHSDVDEGVTVSAVWSGPTGELATSDRIMMSEDLISTLPYTLHSTLTITTVDLSEDDGTFTCTATVTPLTTGITGVSGLATVTINVVG